MITKKFGKFKNKIWLSSPTMHNGDEMVYVKEAYDTNWMSTVGENINQIENKVCEKLGCKYSVALSSGTSALHLAIKLAGVKPGDRVFCTDMTFCATINPIMYEGGIPIFIDTEYDTWNMDPVALEHAFRLYPEVKVVVIVNLYGVPGKLDELKLICNRHNAIIVEDAAESMGAIYNGKQTGTFGDYGVISFNGNKIITGTCGGMLLTNSKRDAMVARKWSTQSREDALWYQHEEIGYNYRMSNVVAGIVRGQLPHLGEHILRKKEIYMRYKKGFEGLPVKMNPFDEQKSEPNYWLSCMIIDKEAMCKQIRDDNKALYIPEKGKSCPTEILDALANCNVEGRPIWKPMHMQPIYRMNEFITRYGSKREFMDNNINDGLPLDISIDIFERGLCLPSNNKMTNDEQDKIIEIVRSCFE